MDRKQHHLQVQQVPFLLVKLIEVKIKPKANHLQDLIVDKFLHDPILISKLFDIFEYNLQYIATRLGQFEEDLGICLPAEDYNLGHEQIEEAQTELW